MRSWGRLELWFWLWLDSSCFFFQLSSFFFWREAVPQPGHWSWGSKLTYKEILPVSEHLPGVHSWPAWVSLQQNGKPGLPPLLFSAHILKILPAWRAWARHRRSPTRHIFSWSLTAGWYNWLATSFLGTTNYMALTVHSLWGWMHCIEHLERKAGKESFRH